jgi:hypothetical protein
MRHPEPSQRVKGAPPASVVRIIVKYENGHEKPLNVTIHGKTQMAVEGMRIHVMDDDGKDVKLDIVEKTAKPPASQASRGTPVLVVKK